MIKRVLYGWLISFLGAIPLGAINITAFEISVTKGFSDAFFFAMGALIVEMFLVWLTLKYDHLIQLNSKYLKPLLIICIVVLTLLAINSFLNATTVTNLRSTSSPNSFVGFTFLFGVLLSAINPLQFPYWIVWNKVLIRRQILENTAKKRISYILGIGLGTFSALLLFIVFAQYIIEYYQKHHYISKVILGILYICLAIYFAIKLLKKK